MKASLMKTKTDGAHRNIAGHLLGNDWASAEQYARLPAGER